MLRDWKKIHFKQCDYLMVTVSCMLLFYYIFVFEFTAGYSQLPRTLILLFYHVFYLMSLLCYTLTIFADPGRVPPMWYQL